jgi:hypothetical protein
MVTLEIIDVFNLGVALVTANSTAVNGTTVLGPALNSLNSFFAQVAEAIPRIIAAGIILLIGFIIGDKYIPYLVKHLYSYYFLLDIS